MGNKPNRAEPLDEGTIKKLEDSGQLGLHSAHALLNTVWYFNTELYGFRGSDENCQLKWVMWRLLRKSMRMGRKGLHYSLLKKQQKHMMMVRKSVHIHHTVPYQRQTC